MNSPNRDDASWASRLPDHPKEGPVARKGIAISAPLDARLRPVGAWSARLAWPTVTGDQGSTPTTHDKRLLDPAHSGAGTSIVALRPWCPVAVWFHKLPFNGPHSRVSPEPYRVIVGH